MYPKKFRLLSARPSALSNQGNLLDNEAGRTRGEVGSGTFTVEDF